MLSVSLSPVRALFNAPPKLYLLYLIGGAPPLPRPGPLSRFCGHGLCMIKLSDCSNSAIGTPLPRAGPHWARSLGWPWRCVLAVTMLQLLAAFAVASPIVPAPKPTPLKAITFILAADKHDQELKLLPAQTTSAHERRELAPRREMAMGLMGPTNFSDEELRNLPYNPIVEKDDRTTTWRRQLYSYSHEASSYHGPGGHCVVCHRDSHYGCSSGYGGWSFPAVNFGGSYLGDVKKFAVRAKGGFCAYNAAFSVTLGGVTATSPTCQYNCWCGTCVTCTAESAELTGTQSANWAWGSNTFSPNAIGGTSCIDHWEVLILIEPDEP